MQEAAQRPLMTQRLWQLATARPAALGEAWLKYRPRHGWESSESCSAARPSGPRQVSGPEPYDGALVGTVHYAGPAEIRTGHRECGARVRGDPEATDLEARGRPARRRRGHHRAARGAGAGDRARGRQADQDGARLEADPAAFAFRVTAKETKRIHGEILSLDWLPGTENREAHIRRIPLGPVAGITPFNFPLWPIWCGERKR
jgi:acyl-CoA reductase-like NAD-dependent aldehyde dehydrogenase